MALGLLVPDPFSTQSVDSYARITDFSVQLKEARLQIVVSFYRDKQSRDANKKHLFTKVYLSTGQEMMSLMTAVMSVPADVGHPLFDAVKSALYVYLKSRPEFKDARDE